MAQGVMELLEEINQNGTTVIMVTHDPALAARAKREVRLLDGAMLDGSASAATESAA
jgi:putative ABC transport system ATP-binding protein